MDVGEIYKVFHMDSLLNNPYDPYNRPCYYMIESIREDDQEHLVVDLVKVHADDRIWIDNWSISIMKGEDLQHFPFTFELWARP